MNRGRGGISRRGNPDTGRHRRVRSSRPDTSSPTSRTPVRGLTSTPESVPELEAEPVQVLPLDLSNGSSSVSVIDGVSINNTLEEFENYFCERRGINSNLSPQQHVKSLPTCLNSPAGASPWTPDYSRSIKIAKTWPDSRESAHHSTNASGSPLLDLYKACLLYTSPSPRDS